MILDGQFNDCNNNGMPDACDVRPRLLAVSQSGDIDILYLVDTSDASATPIGPLHPGVAGCSDLVWRKSGSLYGLVGLEGSDWLWLAEVDPESGFVHPICPFSQPPEEVELCGIAFHDDGTLYGVDIYGAVYVVDPHSCAMTPIQGLYAGSCAISDGLAIQPQTNWLYHAWHYIYGDGEHFYCQSGLWRVDLATGQSNPCSEPDPCPVGPLAFHPSGVLVGYGGGWGEPADYFEQLYRIDACEWELIGNGQVPMRAVSFWSPDCNGNGVPDECEVAAGTSPDCNGNGIPDECDVAAGTSPDCNGNGVPDECELACNDCNDNGVPDECDIASGFSTDCNGDEIPDECELLWNDCNHNGVPDDCDIANGTSEDINPPNGCPDECDWDDCNNNGLIDLCDLDCGALGGQCDVPGCGESADLNHNCVPDECEPCLCDLDCDGNCDGYDIQPFVLALTNPQQYCTQYPDCDHRRADINCDGVADGFDIQPFVECLVGK